MRARHKVKLSGPSLKTLIRIDERFENGLGLPASYYLITTIYNEGDLAARKLKGRWKLFSPDNSVKSRDVPISLDNLGVSLDLEHCKLEGATVWPSMRSNIPEMQAVKFYVDIELAYFGLSDHKREHYRARYKFNCQHKKMVRES